MKEQKSGIYLYQPFLFIAAVFQSCTAEGQQWIGRRNNSLQNVPYMYSYDPWYEDACNLPKLCEGMAHIGAVIASSIITRYRVFWNGWSEIARHVINHQMC